MAAADDTRAARPDRLMGLFIPDRYLIWCLTNPRMRVEGLEWFEVVGCRYDAARKGVVVLARSPYFAVVAAGADGVLPAGQEEPALK